MSAAYHRTPGTSLTWATSPDGTRRPVCPAPGCEGHDNRVAADEPTHGYIMSEAGYLVFTCDRCGAQGCERPGWLLTGRGELGYEAQHACPACVTDYERVDALLSQIECDVLGPPF